MNLYTELKLFRLGFTTVAGVDEVGIGALAGPVIATCVIFDGKSLMANRLWHKEVRDSKLLSEKNREELFGKIKTAASDIGIGIVKPSVVDRINVYQAGIKAMEKALQKLSLEPEFLLIDGRVKLASINGNQKSIVDGDAKVFTIACASIVAKVTRDRMMRKYHKAFPHYGFDRHKGYGTKLHLEKLKKFGPCEIHRKSYAPVKRVLHRV